MMGLGTGDLLRAARHEIRLTLRKTGKDRKKAVQLGIARLLDGNLITAKDAKRLSRITKDLFSHKKTTTKPGVLNDIQSAYCDMASDRNSSPTALAIVGATLGAISVTGGKTGVIRRASDAGEVSGAFIGGIVGGCIGGLWGGVGGAVGAYIGSTIGAVVGACFD